MCFTAFSVVPCTWFPCRVKSPASEMTNLSCPAAACAVRRASVVPLGLGAAGHSQPLPGLGQPSPQSLCNAEGPGLVQASNKPPEEMVGLQKVMSGTSRRSRSHPPALVGLLYLWEYWHQKHQSRIFSLLFPHRRGFGVYFPSRFFFPLGYTFLPSLPEEVLRQWFAQGSLTKAQLLSSSFRNSCVSWYQPQGNGGPRADICRSLCCAGSSFNAEWGNAVGRNRFNGIVMLLLLGHRAGVTAREKSVYSFIFPWRGKFCPQCCEISRT